jgi:hypothetical protein
MSNSTTPSTEQKQRLLGFDDDYVTLDPDRKHRRHIPIVVSLLLAAYSVLVSIVLIATFFSQNRLCRNDSPSRPKCMF